MAELGEANIGGRMVPAWLLNLTAEELDSLKSRWYSNPNILDNWYFTNPVNQRGDTQHTGASVTYFIDRWKCGGYNQTIELTQQGLHWSSNTGIWLGQPIENYDDLVGKVVTVSALIDNVLYSATGTVSKTGSIATRTPSDVYLEVTHVEKGVRFVTYSTNTQQISILAVKLELGSQQTLAHQENDVWVLNEIPDYGEQLRRCQRYFVNFNPNKVNWFAMPPAVASNTTQAYSAVTLPVAMRAQPVVSYGGNIALSQDVDHLVTGMIVSDQTFTGNSIQLRYDVSAGTLTANALYRTQGRGDSSSYIWLSADL